MNSSEQIDQIAAAMAAANKTIGNVDRDRNNPHTHSTYATLAAVLAVVRPPLAENGISVIQSPVVDGAKVTVETRLLHASGQWLAVHVTTTARRAVTHANRAPGGAAFEPADDPQSIGSSITYLRRYGLMAICGVAAETDDDDGNAATPTAEAVAKVGAASPRRGKKDAVAEGEPVADAAAADGKPAADEPAPAAADKPVDPPAAAPAAGAKRRSPKAADATKPADPPAPPPVVNTRKVTQDELRALEQGLGAAAVEVVRKAKGISMAVPVAAIAGQSNAGDYWAALTAAAVTVNAADNDRAVAAANA